MRSLQPNDRVVVRTGYAQGAVGVVRAVDDGIGQTLYRVDYDAFVVHERHASEGGDDPAASLAPASGADA
jgi:hypothetical protein